MSGSASRASRQAVSGAARPGPEAGQPDVELDERAARVERAQLLDPVLAPGPGGEGGAELRLERVVAGEDPSRLRALPRLVQSRGAPELPRLGVVADPERERERRETGARLRLRSALRPLDLVGREHGRARDDNGCERRERGDDDSRAGPRGHAARLEARCEIGAGRGAAPDAAPGRPVVLTQATSLGRGRRNALAWSGTPPQRATFHI